MEGIGSSVGGPGGLMPSGSSLAAEVTAPRQISMIAVERRPMTLMTIVEAGVQTEPMTNRRNVFRRAPGARFISACSERVRWTSWRKERLFVRWGCVGKAYVAQGCREGWPYGKAELQEIERKWW